MALLTELEDKIADTIGNLDENNFIYDFMREMGIPKATVTKLQKGTKTANMATVPGDIWSNKNVYYRQTSKNILAEFTDVKSIVDSKQGNTPRIIIVTDFKKLLALDTKTGDTLDIVFTELPLHFDFFLPWQGIEKVDYEAENPADIKAAERFAKIYDILFQDNTEMVTVKQGQKTVTKHVFSEETINETAFNNFLIRVLFALFAEDTDIFPRGSFTNVLKTMTNEDGSNMNTILSELFTVLDQPKGVRGDLANWLSQFPYVNGSLFTAPHENIVFSAKSRRLIIDAGELLDWTQVNPDIFGSMVQAVTGEDDRSHLGMHYTSVPNIMKVIKPLFLDSLNAEFEAAYDSEKKLNELNDRMSRMKFFDPAVGSGNFLIITYKELRRLEIKIMKRLATLTGSPLYVPFISLKQFYGIEIEEFATDIAKLSLWIAEHQMNVELRAELNGVVRPTLPLQNAGAILTLNSLTVDWNEILNQKPNEKVFIFGNPPYLGYSLQNSNQKSDMQHVFGNVLNWKRLDYIAAWFYKAAQYIDKNNAATAFVTTNSINQGEQVANLWPTLLTHVAISFANRSFKWTNNAKNNAGVIVSIIGFVKKTEPVKKVIFEGNTGQVVDNIGPYLNDGSDLVVKGRTKPLFNLPKITNGNRPVDGGNLIFSTDEYNDAVDQYPILKQYLLPFIGSAEFLRSEKRQVLWVSDAEYPVIANIPIISERIEAVKKMRNSDDSGTSAHSVADVPWAFFTRKEFETAKRNHFNQTSDPMINILVPRVSSENRDYVPMGVVSEDIIISDSAMAIYDAPLWVLAILESKMHTVWLRTLGGKLKNDFRYSGKLVYNTFPIPRLSIQAKKTLENKIMDIMDIRDEIGGSLGVIYNRNTMPDKLREAHDDLDVYVDGLYRRNEGLNDSQRLSILMKMYEKKLGGE